MEGLTITIYLKADVLKKLDRLRKELEEENPELFKGQTVEEIAALVSAYKFQESLNELLGLSGKQRTEGVAEDADS